MRGDGLIDGRSVAQVVEDLLEGIESETLDQELDDQRRFVVSELEVQIALG